MSKWDFEDMLQSFGMIILLLMGLALAIILVACAIGITSEQYSKYSYCRERQVPYGVCDEYLKENFATQNIKVRVNKSVDSNP